MQKDKQIQLENVFRFRRFPMYRDSLLFNKEMRTFIREHFSHSEKYVLTAQMNRALDSIVLNIAEGSDRGTDKDFANYLNYSKTSLNEVVACLDVALECCYCSEVEHPQYLSRAARLSEQLTAFRRMLLQNPKK